MTISPCPQGLAHSRHAVWVVVELTVNKNDFAVKITLPNISALPDYAFNYENFSYWGPHDSEGPLGPRPHPMPLQKALRFFLLKIKCPHTGIAPEA